MIGKSVFVSQGAHVALLQLNALMAHAPRSLEASASGISSGVL